MTKEVPVEDQGIIFAVETDEDSTEREMEKQKIQVHPEVRLVVRRMIPSLGRCLPVFSPWSVIQVPCRRPAGSCTYPIPKAGSF